MMPQSRSGGVNQQLHKQPPQDIHYPFWFGGGASCFAACVTHPLDLGE